MDEIGVGMLGYAFMGRAHSNAFVQVVGLADAPLRPRLVGIAGRDERAVGEAAERFGYDYATTDWRQLVADETIGLFDNGGPNSLHAEPTIAAAEAGKHVVCEKPLGRDADESHEIWSRVAATGVKHLCAFNYRFVPAVRRARELVAAGELGEVVHFRGRYLQDWGPDASDEAWRFRPAESGSGALGDIASHVVDQARFLCGEIAAVSGRIATYVPGRAVDDAAAAVVEFENGALGTIEATRMALGRKNALQWEINGTKGSLLFDLERLNELWLSRGADGFQRIVVQDWWPEGHVVGWADSFVHELAWVLHCVANDDEIAPWGATFEDGYRCAEVLDAIARGGREEIAYRGLKTLS
jgi:predicted dehydrogenase